MTQSDASQIRVPWKNVALAACGVAFLLIFLSLLTAKNMNALQYSAVSLGALVSLVFAIRATRISIVIRQSEFLLRRIAFTKRICVDDIRSIEVGEQVSPITRYFIVFNLKSGAKIKMKDVFLWGVSKRSRELAEDWARTLTSILN